MGQVRIVTDSTADIPRSLAEELGIVVVPCEIYWGTEVYQDGVDLTPEEFYDRLAHARELPSTSQPALSSFIEAFRRLLDDPGCDGIVAIVVAGTLSGTLNGAWTAAQTLPDPGRVSIVDSRQVSMGQGWAVVEAARLARAGASLSGVTRAVQEMVPRLRAGAMIDELDNLYKSGRVSRLWAVLGTTLQIKPVLNIQDGQVTIAGRVRTRARALDHLVALAKEWGPALRAGVLHTGAPELAEELVARLSATWFEDTCLLGPAGFALATHLGLGAVGVTALLAANGEHG